MRGKLLRRFRLRLGLMQYEFGGPLSWVGPKAALWFTCLLLEFHALMQPGVKEK